MPDKFDHTGLQVKTLTEIIDETKKSLKDIFGDDVNLDQHSPDGQLINIFAQSAADMRETLANAVASIDPDQAEGIVLDQRVALNGLIRKLGTYTTVNVLVTTDRALNLIGLDDKLYDINASGYTIKDGIGNKFILAKSQNFPGAGTYSCVFRAADIGNVQVTPNTLTSPETVVPGVTNLNNPDGALVQGVDEESDEDLRLRRSISFGLASVGQLDSLEASLWNTKQVTDVYVDENNLDGTVGGIPAHSLWIIVEGGADSDIGQVIYAKKSSGCGTFGSKSVTVIRTNGRTVSYNFDRPIYQPLHLKAKVGYLGNGTVNLSKLKDYIVKNLKYKLKETSTADDFITIIKNFNENYYVENALISVDSTKWQQVISPSTPQVKFTLSPSNMDFTVA